MSDRRALSPRHRLVGIVVTLSVLAALTGCVSIPGSGPVTQGVSLNPGSGTSNFQYNPDGPEKNASTRKILLGFVSAFTSATGGYAVAKSFLSSGFAAKWDPRHSVQVRNGAPQVVQVDSATMDYSFNTIATVNSSGAYSESTQSTTLEFSFVREHGQWRINAAPDGIVLPKETFTRIFDQHVLYFLDAKGSNLIPDLRWFPTGTAATRIVTALLAGPPDWLKGAAFSKFPDGTQLSDAGSIVTVEGGVAKVDLTKEALAASPSERQYMLVQLQESLRSVSSISRVSISVQGAPLPIGDLSDAPQPDNKVDSQALVLRKGQFGFYANNTVATLSGISTKVTDLKPRAATISADQNTVAVLGSTGVVSVVRKNGPTVALDSRPGLIAPSLDSDGYVWAVPASDPNGIRAYDQSGLPHNVAPALPADSQIVSLEISRDGARVVILLSTSTGPRLVVAAILRDPNQKQAPVSLGPPILDLPLQGDSAVDATWVDQTTVATLLGRGVQSSVDQYVIGGEHTALGTLAPATAIVGGNLQDGLRVLGADSSIWSYRGSSWQDSKVKVDFIANQR